MDKSWMQMPKCSPEYIRGCKAFLEFAWKHRPMECGDTIYCPCTQCINMLSRSRKEVEDHIMQKGILRTYVRWMKHGEDEEVMICIDYYRTHSGT